MLQSIRNNKKAQGGDIVVIVLSILFMLLIFLIFYVIIGFKENAAGANIESQTNNIGDPVTFLTYLRSDIGSNRTMTDLIIKSYVTKDYNELNQKTKSVLSYIYGQEKNWLIMFDGKVITYVGVIDTKNLAISTSIQLPTYDGNVFEFGLAVQK